MILTVATMTLIGLFIYLFTPLIGLYKRLDDAQSWKKTEADVLDARVLRNSGWISRFINPKAYFYARFEVDGRKYGTTSISLHKANNAQDRAFVNGIERGSKIDIYHDPQKPHINCALNPEDHSTSVLVIKKLMAFLFFTFLYFYLVKVVVL